MWWIALSLAEAQSIQLLETGTDLPVIADVVCGQEVTRSDLNGVFTISETCQSIVVRSPYHVDLTVNVSNITSDRVFLVPLREQETILIEEDRAPSHGQTYGLNVDELSRTPGGFDDPIRLIQSLPGTVSTREFGPNAGDVILRGAAPTESRLYIDGVEVPYLYHFDQYASILPTKFVDSVVIHPSNFGTSYGDAIGGIVSLESKEANPSDTMIYAQGNLIMAGVQASTPVKIQGEEVGVLSISGRRSFADLYESGNEQYSLWPTFSDYAIRYDIRNAEGHHFRVSALGSMDRYGRYIYDADELNPYERSVNPNLNMHRRFDGGVFQWDWRSPEYRAKTSIAAMRDDWTASIDSQNGPSSQKRLDKYTWIRHESIVIRQNIEWSVGFDQRLGKIDQDVTAAAPNPVIAQDAPLLAQGQNLDRSLKEWRQGVWVEPRINKGDWRIIPGIRIQGLPMQQMAVVDPRVQVHHQYDWGNVHFGFGRYHQSPPLERPEETKFAEADQISTGIEWIRRGTDVLGGYVVRVGMDVWGKQVRNKWYTTPDGGVLTVEEESIGGELYLASQWARWDARLGLSSVNSQLLYRGEKHLSPYDQPFFLNAMLGWKSEEWILGVRYRRSSGLPYNNPTGSILDANQDSYIAQWSTFPTQRMPIYQKVDLQIARVWQLRKSELRVYCEAWAVPSSSNYLYPIYNYDYSEQQLVVGPAFLPLIGMSIER